MIVKDQLDRRLDLKVRPASVISLVPSHTELLIDLGLAKCLTGRTKFCIHPQDIVHDIQIIGGTKAIHHDRIRTINPELIIANKEENTKEDVIELEKHYPVWISNINTLEHSYQMIESMAKIFTVKNQAQSLINESKTKFESLKSLRSQQAVYLIWRKPYMTIGSDTYIHHIMDYLGFDNLFKNELRYPKIEISDIINAAPDVVLLSSEPFPFDESHKRELKHALPNTKIELVDGEVFSWYGSRILYKNSILIN